MINQIYNTGELVKYLDLIRKYIITNPDCIIVSERGQKVFAPDIYEKTQDMCYEDMDPVTKTAWPYPYYLEKYPEGTERYILALYAAVSEIANNILITDKGGCDYANHRSVTSFGYHIRKGSGDSFGWLSGKICCNDFQFSYG